MTKLTYKIDNIPVKEFQIKFIATLENGETIDLTKLLGISRFGQNLDQIVKLNMNDAYWEFSDRCCEMFGKDGNLPLSAIEEDAELDAELHREIK